MSDTKKALPDSIDTIKFNMNSQEQFLQDRGIVFEHWAALPSPIGLKDRGDYRRSETLDTESSNGFIYKKVGCFTGLIVSNNRNNQPVEGGIFDNASARLILAKYYESPNGGEPKEITLLPGDRIYARDCELRVDNYQRAQYSVTREDYLQFPALTVSYLIDSTNTEYIEGRHFKITTNGNLRWSPKKNPGIDPDTGKGRIYGIRYTYKAFWYVHQLLNEIRITNTEDKKNPTRMPYQAIIQREYIYHNQNRGAAPLADIPQPAKPRTQEQPKDTINPNKNEVLVDMANFLLED